MGETKGENAPFNTSINTVCECELSWNIPYVADVLCSLATCTMSIPFLKHIKNHSVLLINSH